MFNLGRRNLFLDPPPSMWCYICRSVGEEGSGSRKYLVNALLWLVEGLVSSFKHNVLQGVGKENEKGPIWNQSDRDNTKNIQWWLFIHYKNIYCVSLSKTVGWPSLFPQYRKSTTFCPFLSYFSVVSPTSKKALAIKSQTSQYVKVIGDASLYS